LDKTGALALDAPRSTEILLNTVIALFLLFGASFGFATYSKRHLFSEGPTHSEKGQAPDFLNGRILWMLVCTFLWPIMVLTGLNSWVLIARRARRAQASRALSAKRD
jgi:hypothetical protein